MWCINTKKEVVVHLTCTLTDRDDGGGDRDDDGARANTIWICVAFEMGQSIRTVHKPLCEVHFFFDRFVVHTSRSIKVQFNEFLALAGLDQMEMRGHAHTRSMHIHRSNI